MKVDKTIIFETDKEEKELISKTIKFLLEVRSAIRQGNQYELNLRGETIMTDTELRQMVDLLYNFTSDETYEII